ADAAARRADEADVRAAAAGAELAGALGCVDDLDGAVVRALAEVAAAEAAVVAAEALSSAQVELDRALAAAQRACAAAGFAAPEDALEAARTTDWRDDAVLRLREAADAQARVAEALADPELDVDLSPPAPVEATAAELAEADAVLARELGVLAECRQRRTSLDRLLPTLEQELTALVPLEERAREVRQLADLCAGQGANGLKMTLTSFVLAARLEEVAAAASVRLLRMTQGRYSLVHTDGAARGGQRSGLGLLARDGWTGQDRDTSTLSGGETFLASLALALGLADVVSAEAGGSRIGALFVDEGFGTLDEDTLDEVMDVLDGLREGGRVVGLVSHVAELRQRIPAQVQVLKTRTGSDVVLHGC
ncbi:MAG: putative exonuclease, partial [Frankiales bacterium]|nr:putative exonuclease [Frankiales bacterium]